MKKSLILLSVYMLLVSSVIGQTTTVISGVICNASGKGIPDVNVYVSGLKQKYSVLASCLSDLNGSFSLSFKSTTDSISINASGLNIMNTTVVCENKSQYKQIIVDEKAQELGEVVIRAPKIYSKGDTISYFVRSFQSKNDMSIGQVLRRLPGIAVSDEGRISYKGQPIKKFYIEGLDLMKGRYGIATSNIDPNSISTIEILENHQDIKALEGLKPEERASINLKLKKGVKGVFNLIGSLGGGYGDGLLWDNELIATYFQRSRQLIATYKGNNSGKDLETELRSFGDYDYTKTSVISDIVMPGDPNISKRHYYFNRSHSATYNQMFRVGKRGELGLNISFLNDRDKRINRSTTATLLPDGTKNIVDEQFSGVLNRNLGDGNATYTRNTEKSYIKEQLKFDWSLTEGLSNIKAGKDIVQKNRIENYRIYNLFHLTNRTGNNNGIEFLSRLNLEKRPHNLLVTPNLFRDIIASDRMFQTAERRNISTENRLDFLSAFVLGSIQIHPTVSFDYTIDELTSTLDTYRNNVGLTSVNSGAGIIAHYKKRQFYADLYISGNYKFFNLNDRCTRVAYNKHRIVIEPRLAFKYDIDGTNEIRFSYILSHSTPAIENLYNQNILTSYRQLSSYDNNALYQSQLHVCSLSYDYKGVVPMLFFGADISYTHARPDVLYGSYHDGITERITSLQTDETINIFSIRFRASKGLDWKGMKIGTELRYNHRNSPVFLQDKIIRYNERSITAKTDLNFNPFDWMSCSYDSIFYLSHTMMVNGKNMPVLLSLANNVLLEFYLPFNVTVGANVYHYFNNQNRNNTSYLLGEANIKYSYNRWSFTLYCDNIFNKTKYLYSASRGLSEFTSTYYVRPRSVLLKIRCRIL